MITVSDPELFDRERAPVEVFEAPKYKSQGSLSVLGELCCS